MVIRLVVSEILGEGVVPPPQILLSCQKEQVLLTVNIYTGSLTPTISNLALVSDSAQGILLATFYLSNVNLA